MKRTLLSGLTLAAFTLVIGAAAAAADCRDDARSASARPQASDEFFVSSRDSWKSWQDDSRSWDDESGAQDHWWHWREDPPRDRWDRWDREYREARVRRHEDERSNAGLDFSVLGGVGALQRNHTGLPDNVYSAPAVGMLGIAVNSNLALEGEFTLSVPVDQELHLAPGIETRRRGPDLLLYQGGLRLSMPAETYSLYVAGGAGMATFLVNDLPDRFPQIGRVEHMLAANAGVGTMIYLDPLWSLRLDYRELALFPGSDSPEFSANGEARRIWMQRATLGFTYGRQPRVEHEEFAPFHYW